MRGASLPSPLSIVHMNTTQDPPSLQARLNEFFGQLAQCPELHGLSPEDLPRLLQAGLSSVLNAALQKERQFHLEDHPEDRAPPGGQKLLHSSPGPRLALRLY